MKNGDNFATKFFFLQVFANKVNVRDEINFEKKLMNHSHVRTGPGAAQIHGNKKRLAPNTD